MVLLIPLSNYKVLDYVNRTVQWRCPSALPPSGTGNRIS